MNYRQKEERPAAINFSARLRNMVDDHIRAWRDGVDMNSEKKGHSPFILRRSHDMSDEVFELGCRISDMSPELQPVLWMHWMMNAEIHRSSDGIVVFHRSDFFRQNAESILGSMIRQHVGVPVRFAVDRGIAQRVEQ